LTLNLHASLAILKIHHENDSELLVIGTLLSRKTKEISSKHKQTESMFLENCFSGQTNVEFDCFRVKQVRKIPITNKNIVKSIEDGGN
jgi:hypothetical protein